MYLNRHRIVPAKTSFETLNPEAEEARFLAALDKTRQQILEIQKRLHDKIGAKQSLIFDAHLLVLEDPAVLEEVNRKIREEKLSSEYIKKSTVYDQTKLTNGKKVVAHWALQRASQIIWYTGLMRTAA